MVKAYRDDPESLACFTAEAAGLAFTMYGPTLLAVDIATPLVLMTDLGSAPSLSDALLGESASAGRAGLLAWATGYGKIGTTSIGRQDELVTVRKRYDRGQPSWDGADWINDRIKALPNVLDALHIAAPTGLAADLAVVAELAEPNACPVFSPGDICPENNLLTPDGLRVLDFEGAGYHPVFLDAAYATMPFATCLPAMTELAQRLLAATENWAVDPLPLYPAFRSVE